MKQQPIQKQNFEKLSQEEIKAKTNEAMKIFAIMLHAEDSLKKLNSQVEAKKSIDDLFSKKKRTKKDKEKFLNLFSKENLDKKIITFLIIEEGGKPNLKEMTPKELWEYINSKGSKKVELGGIDFEKFMKTEKKEYSTSKFESYRPSMLIINEKI